MKSQVKVSPQRSTFAWRSGSRFSPMSSTPASASAPISWSGTYLPATSTSTSGPATACTSSSRARSRAGSMSSIISTIG